MGLVIIGYPGIGKTSASNPSEGIIDFESSFFRENGISRNEDWHITYVRQAIDLANQGYIPLLSSHKVVRDDNNLIEYSRQKNNRVVTIAPMPDLQEKWLKRLKDRYNYNPSSANYASYTRATNHFEEDVIDMSSEKYFSHIYINDLGYYDLERIILGLRLTM